MNISYADKDNVSPEGTPERTWSADDANEVKAAVNSKADNTPNLNGLSNLPAGNGFVRKTGSGTFTTTEDVATLVGGKVPASQLPAPNFLGVFTSLAALESAYPTAQPGNEAQVDEGVGTDVVKYIWDATDGAWKAGGGVGASSFSDLSGSPFDNAALNTALSDLDTQKEDVSNKSTNLTSPDDIKYPTTLAVSTALAGKQNSLGFTPENVVNKATSLASPDNTKYPTTQAVATGLTTAENNAKAYADGLVVGLLDDRGNFSAAGGAYPSSGGSGPSGTILKGDLWTINVAGTLPTAQAVGVGDVIRALVDSPGNTQANWVITENNLGYVPENAANKGVASGYMGIDATFRPIIKNAAGTTSSFITSIATVARTYTLPDRNITFAGTDEIPTKANQAAVDSGSDDTQFLTPLTNRGNQEKFRSVVANFTVDSADRGGTITANSGSDLTATVNQITPGTTLPQVQILSRGAGNINLVAGSGVSFVGSTFIEAGGGALLSWLSATLVQVVTGSSAQWPQILLKPTTVVGYAMTDAWRVLFQTFTTVGTPNSTTETDLLTREVGSGLLAFDGERVVIEAAGRFAATPSNSKRLRVYLGTTMIVDTTAVVIGSVQWTARIVVMRTATDAQRAWATITYGTSQAAGYVEKLTSDMTASLSVIIKGTGVATADVTLDMAAGDKTGKA